MSKKALFITSSAIITALFLTGCKPPPAVTPQPTQQTAPIKNIPVVMTPTTEEVPADPFFPILKGTDIYCAQEKIGKTENGRVYLKIYDATVSFDAKNWELNKVFCSYDFTVQDKLKYLGFTYDGLEISPKLYGPYGIYTAVETPEQNQKISFKCDGSLVQPSDKKPIPTFYCSTNGKDYLTQYEFQTASVFPMITTGGEYSVAWKKVFIKKSSGFNYFFLGNLGRNEPGYDDYWIAGDSAEKYAAKSSKKALDNLVKYPPNSTKIAEWQKIADSFRVETTNLIN